MRRTLAVLLALLISLPALAVEPSEMLKDPALESRARSLSRELRCVVCQNQSIDDSAAEVAHNANISTIVILSTAKDPSLRSG
jgi:cytochrome c-type biogenesis protein CcmH